MKTLSALFLALLLVSASAAFADDKKPTAEEAEQAATKWLDGLGKAGLVLEEKSDEHRFSGKMVGRTGNSMFVYQEPGWWVTLIFKGKITDDTDLKTLQENFQRIALDSLPTPGLEAPGWEIKPRTLVSSFSEGVELLSFEGGVIKFRVQTKCFALYGRDPSVPLRADGPAPKHAYFQVRKSFPLDLTMEAKLSMGK